MTNSGSSIDSGLRERFESAVGSAGEQAAAIGESLLGVVGALAERPTVRRALVDAGRSAEDRVKFARQLFGERVEASALDVLAAAVEIRWARPSAFVAALTELGLQAHLAAAEANGRLREVEDELFRFGQTLRSESALRSALTDNGAPRQSKAALVHTLLDDKAKPETVRLAEYAVLDRRDGSLENELERIVDLAAARNKRRVAVVHVASALTNDHRERLRRALSEQSGQAVQLNVLVEPDLVGGLKIEIGDDVIDGSVSARLDDARRRLVAGR